MATDESCSSAKTLAIHKEKFNVLLSGDEPNDLSNIAKHFKTFTGLAEIAKNKGLGEKPEVMIVVMTLPYRGTKSDFFFAGTFTENRRKFKISVEGANLHLTFIIFCSN